MGNRGEQRSAAPDDPSGEDRSGAPAVPPARTSVRRFTPARAATLAVFALAGLLIMASALTARGTDLRAGRSGDVAGLVRQQAEVLARTQAEVDEVSARVAALAAADGSSSDEVRSTLATLSPAAGLTPVTGPAVSVTLDDAPRPSDGRTLPGNPSPDDLVVHQQDVQAVVNAMWRAGASGVSIMDQRLVSTSAVRCVGNTLLLGGRVYSPPFRIVAVGDQARIQRELDTDPQVSIYREYVDIYGLGYLVTTDPRVTLPAFTGPLPPAGSST